MRKTPLRIARVLVAACQIFHFQNSIVIVTVYIAQLGWGVKYSNIEVILRINGCHLRTEIYTLSVYTQTQYSFYFFTLNISNCYTVFTFMFYILLHFAGLVRDTHFRKTFFRQYRQSQNLHPYFQVTDSYWTETYPYNIQK